MKTARQLLQGKPREALVTRPDATVHDAMALMTEENVGALLVLEGETLVGIVSERDFARQLFQHEKSPKQIPVSEIMTRQVIYVSPDQTNEECMALMTDERVRHLPVLENGRVLGVVSIGDLVKDTISGQRLIIEQLRASLDENERMHERLRDAGVRTTTLNEQFLHRIAADLHDGPAQTIAFALMRFEDLVSVCTACALPQGGASHELRTIHDALRSALRDVRNIASGLVMPGIAKLSLADTARRAVRDFERMSGQTVQAEVDAALDKAPLAIKITVYRLLRESLANSWRHAPGGAPRVRVRQSDGQALVEITDHGAGFNPQAVALSGRLGLAFMRERVRLLGGVFEVDSVPGRGTCIRARLPLSTAGMIHA